MITVGGSVGCPASAKLLAFFVVRPVQTLYSITGCPHACRSVLRGNPATSHAGRLLLSDAGFSVTTSDPTTLNGWAPFNGSNGQVRVGNCCCSLSSTLTVANGRLTPRRLRAASLRALFLLATLPGMATYTFFRVPLAPHLGYDLWAGPVPPVIVLDMAACSKSPAFPLTDTLGPNRLSFPWHVRGGHVLRGSPRRPCGSALVPDYW